jgi:hypothetical protein
MALHPKDTDPSRPAILKRIERETGVPGLVTLLAEMPPTDLQSILLEVHRLRAEQRRPADVLTEYRTNRFVRPSPVSMSSLRRWEGLAFSHLPAQFDTLELSPTCPLGTSSVIAAIDQNWAVSTVRNGEVVSDPTNVLALECALRRKVLLATAGKSSEPVHLATRHRVLRPQRYQDPTMLPHFSIFSLCSAGRDRGNRQFEISALALHARYYIQLLRAFLGAQPTVILSLTDFGETNDKTRLEAELLAPIRDTVTNVACSWNDQRVSGRRYYRDLCCKIYVESESGEKIEVADGGSVDWTQKLLSNSKERLVISGIGSERVCQVFGKSNV